MRVHALAYAQTVLGAALALGCTGSPCPTGQALCGQACIDPQVDNANCGGCGLTCDGCVAGRCKVTLATGHPIGLAVDHSKVYWTNAETAPFGLVLSTPARGGRVSTLVGPESPEPDGLGGIAINSSNAYWIETFGLDVGTFNLMKVPLTGGTSISVGPLQDAFPNAVVANNASVYWTSLGNDATPYGTGYVLTAPAEGLPSGGAPTVLYSSTIWGPCGMALDSENIYWLNGLLPNSDKTELIKMPLKGGSLTTLAHTDSCGRVAVDASSVYWTTISNIYKVPLTGGPAVTLASGPTVNPYALAIDSTNVYWVNGNDLAIPPCEPNGTVMKAPLAGGSPPTILSAHENYPTDIAVDDTSVYWITVAKVKRLTPK